MRETRLVSGVTGEGIDLTAKVTTETTRDKGAAREALLETHRVLPETAPVTPETETIGSAARARIVGL